eukprot:4893438-Amphidinium_carterae.3
MALNAKTFYVPKVANDAADPCMLHQTQNSSITHDKALYKTPIFEDVELVVVVNGVPLQP